MADIRLAKPAAGTTQTVPSAPDGRFIFDFPADAATLTRSGDNLVLTFEDGASIQLQDFYTTYSKEEMPSFQVEGVEISGQDFFAALGEDLMPAAGPAAGSSASRSGRYNEYGGSDLLDGLDHLGRLDIGFDGGVQLATDTVEPSPYYEDDHGVTVTPSAPGTDPDDPDIPVQGEDFPPTMPHDVLQVDESALDGGSGGGSATADGSMSVSAPDGVATITIGVVVVWQNGALTGNPVQTDEGHLDVTGFDGTNLTYTYTLDKATQEHGKEGGGENDAIAHEMEVVVTDSDGDSGSAVIRVEITDDVPVAYDDMNSLTEVAESVSGNVLDNDESGADGWRTDADGNIAAVVLSGSADGTYGMLTLNADGSYTYTRNETGVPDDGASDTFTYIAYDADGDAVEKTLTITIENTDPTAPGGEGHTLTVTLSDAKTAGGNTDTVSQSVDLFDGPEAFTSAVFGSTENIVVSGGESFTWSQSEGKLIGTGSESGAVVTLEITGISADGTVTVSATLDDPAHHNDGSNSLNISGIVITATDAGGSTVFGTMNVVVTDDAVDVEVINNNASLTVDESYADSITGLGLELESSAKADTTSLNVSSLFSVDAGADGEAGREFALSISNNGQTGQKVLVGGSQYDLTLVQNIDGSISGVAGDGPGTVIFKITISNGGNVTLDMTGYGSLVHPHGGSTAQEHDEALSITGVEVTLTVTDTDGDSDSASADLVLAFEDDGPRLTVATDEVPDAPDTSVRNLGSGEAFSFVPDTPEKPDASDYEGGEEDPKYLAALQEYDTEITAAKQKAEGLAGQLVESNILSQNGWEGVSIYAGKVTYNADGTVDQLTRPSDYCLKYSDYASNSFTVDDKPAADWGIMVASPDDDNKSWADDNYETNVIDGNASEAIVIDLGGQLAYGIELSFGAFYSNYKGTEGVEKLLITFYKGPEIVESRFVDSVDIGSSNTGKVTYSTDLIAGGFDKVVVSAVLGENDRESSFTLQGVDFVTAPLAIAVASGELDVASGADGYAEDFAVANVQFAMEQMFTLQADGTYSLSILDGNNDFKSAIVTVIIDDLGNSRLTATVDGEELFSATLEKDGGSWSWKMEQYQEFLVQGKDGQLGDLELGFITMDGDDDTATETVNIPLKNLPDLAVSQTTLVTDESYINGLGSETGPAGGDDGQANSAQASGTMSVNTYGKEGELILTIDEKVFVFQLDADGKLSGTSEELAVTTTYGTLTLTNGEAGKITYTYTQTKPYHHDPDSGPDQLTDAESFTVTVKDADGNRSGEKTITVSIEDDAPVFSEESSHVDVANESDNYWSHGEKIEFTGQDIAAKFDSKNRVEMNLGGNQLTLYVGKIQFGADGYIDKSKDWTTFIDGQGTFHINGEYKEHGIGVHSNYNGGVDNSKIYPGYDGRENEIGYDPISNQSEAVIINLDKPAVNMNIDLSKFFSVVGSDTNPEEAIFLFYKDGKCVGESHLSSNETSGDVQQNGFEALPAGGFDTVVIAAGDNGTYPDKYDNSEFNISAITFNKFEGVDRTLTGRLDATSADGIKGYSVDTDKLATLGLKSDDMPIKYGWNEDTGRLLAKAGDATVFELVLNTETGAWTMVQYKEYEGNLELPFIATDGDDDRTDISVAIPPTDAESAIHKATDSDAEKTVLAAAEQEMKSAVRSGEALATAAALAGMVTVLPDDVPAADDRPDTPDETMVMPPVADTDAPVAAPLPEEGVALPDSPVEEMADAPLLFENLALAAQEDSMAPAAGDETAEGLLWADVSGTDDTPDATMSGIATSGPGAAPAGTAVPEIVLTGTDGDDILLGGDGDELIFGGSGDDFIDGGAGRDTIYAGAGNDIIVYDQQDYLVSGGNGIDFMVSDDTSLTLDGLLSNTSSDKPLVSGIEVLLKGEDALSLTSIKDLADRYGITLGVNEAGEETLQLDDRWTKQDDGSYDFNGGAEADGGLTLETSLTPVETSDPASEAVQQQVFTLEHSNG
ncbi:DUF5801 repeats-in-toxin domain-containing protein [Desulfovibrio piger]|uniref:DUF5801 repeats-in-toxin domain-containing protein n=1 Tax=Desulfovibrio piger TaxID=901 RepID=UPI0026EFCE4D|nr:VCBS domain-containing protein [Desulfovibrio piger]MBS5807697.1 VCBS domain-containing protein [Desulfovibrio piger]